MKPAACLLLAFAASLLPAAAAQAQTFASPCGAADFRVDATHGQHPLDNVYRLFGGPHGAAAQLLYTADVGGWFFAACVKDGQGRPRLLFQSSCGGSACVEDKFGIVDPATLALVLQPGSGNRGNIKRADALLGRRTPWIANDGSAFCCDEVSGARR
jgi:hypothetical protein